MKSKPLYVCIILFFIFHIKILSQNSVLEKKISLEIENGSLENILKSIEKIGEFKIGYSNNAIDAKKIESINIKNLTVGNVLRTLFPSSIYQFKVINNKVLIFKISDKNEFNLRNHTLSGYIKESGSQEHLLGVSIYVPELKTGTTSNNYGFYSLTLPEGNHEIIISCIGYTSTIKQIHLLHDTVFNIEINAGVENLEEVVLIATQKNEQSKITQMSSFKIKPSDIQSLPTLLGEKDVIKTLQLFPGIQAGNEGTSGFFVRGGTPDQNLIILDDATVYNSNHLLGVFSIFNGDAIKSIEVFKGGFPARFGGRLSSVLKINMKDGNKEKFSGKINIGLISSSLLFEGPIKKGKTSFLLSARRTYADLITSPLQNDDDIIKYHFTDLNLKLHHVLNQKNKLFWSNYFGEDKFIEKYNFYDGDSKTKLWWSNITSTLRWNHEFNQKLFSNTSLIFSNYSLNISEGNYYTTEKIISSTSSGINDLSAKIDFNYYPNNKHSIKFGTINTFHSFTPQNVSIKETQQESITKKQVLNSIESALYIEDDWKLTSKLNIYPGIRFSYFNYKSVQYFNPEPRISVAWKIKQDLTIKASFSKMNQYIHLLSNSGIGLPTDLWVSSTKKIKPQTSKQIAIGVVKDFINSGYALSVEGYYKKLKGIIAYKAQNSLFSLYELDNTRDWENNITSGKGWAYGSEILFRKQTGLLTGWLGYTLSWSQRQFDELNLGRKFNARYDRRHDISLIGIYKPTKKISLSCSWIFSSGINYTLPNSRALTTTNNFPIKLNPYEENKPNAFFNKRNNFKGENTHRLDLGIQFHKKTKKGKERTWDFSIYNTYARKNPFIYTVESPNYLDDNSPPSSSSEQVLIKTSVLITIPSITYTLKF